MATNFDRDWTPFAMDAEAEAFGTARICKTHNQLRKRTEELEKLLQQRNRVEKMSTKYDFDLGLRHKCGMTSNEFIKKYCEVFRPYAYMQRKIIL